jgi:hypothetical protein
MLSCSSTLLSAQTYLRVIGITEIVEIDATLSLLPLGEGLGMRALATSI